MSANTNLFTLLIQKTNTNKHIADFSGNFRTKRKNYRYLIINV